MKTLFLLALLASVPAFASYSYDCRPENGSGDGVDETILINGNTATVSTSDTLNGLNFQVTLDGSYSPKGAPKVRYRGQDKNGNARDLILDMGLTTGVSRGYAQIRGNEDGYWANSYECQRK